mmetsp:Transcript_31894/g.74613  ORF Transcript_31894/g.74613 Transcript_31894/m.74613 type:complete len:599 (+) Transcript_31894:135-1931(+)
MLANAPVAQSYQVATRVAASSGVVAPARNVPGSGEPPRGFAQHSCLCASLGALLALRQRLRRSDGARKGRGRGHHCIARFSKPTADIDLVEVQTHLSDGLYDAAALSLQQAEGAEKCPRALVLEAVARAGMQDYSAAEACLDAAEAALREAGDDSGADINVADLREAVAKLSRQSSRGEYDFVDVYGAALNLCERPDSFGMPFLPRLADYTGPVEVYRSAEGIRGLRTTRQVKGGELLICANPLLMTDIPEASPLDNKEGRLDPFVEELRAACSKSPHVRRVVGELLSDGVSPSSMLVVKDFEWRSTNGDDVGEQLSEEKLAGVTQTNCFEDFGHCCMYPVVAMINHSCTPNTNCIPVGDTLMLRANQVLPEGAEVHIPYFDVLKPFTERQHLTQKNWDFACECPRCTLEKPLPRSLQDRSEDAAAVDAAFDAEPGLNATSREAQWVLGGHAETYKQRVEATFPFSEEAAALRQQLLRAVEATAPASFTHAKLAFLDWVCNKTKDDKNAAMRAMQYAGLVHQTRYGPIPPEHMVKVIQKTELALQSEGVGEEFSQQTPSRRKASKEQLQAVAAPAPVEPLPIQVPDEPVAKGSVVLLD